MRRPLLLLLGVLAVATLLLADERLTLTLKEYLARRAEASSREAYDRALARLKDVKLGMKAAQFFTTMEMIFIRDKKDRGVDGFCEGHLRRESMNLNRGKEPDHILLFGYYEDWKRERRPVQKFRIVFRNNLLTEISFFDPTDDVHHLSGKVASR